MLKNLNLTFNKSNPHPRNRYGSIANEQDLQEYIKKRAARGSTPVVPAPKEKTEEVTSPSLEPTLYVQKESPSDDPWTDEETLAVLSTPEDEIKAQMERIAMEVSEKLAGQAKPRRSRKPKG